MRFVYECLAAIPWRRDAFYMLMLIENLGRECIV
jgi:hypothetical protein